MTANILVTGATGHVGQEVVRLLSAQHCHVIAAVRDPIEAQKILGGEAHCVLFDFTNPDTFVGALMGITKIFLVRPPAIADVHKITPALNAAHQAGVKQIVFLSILGAGHNRFVPHYAIERAIEQLNIPAVFLRTSFFMQNLNTTHRDDILLEHRLFLPAGHGKTSFIDVRDIAAVAVKILSAEKHDNSSKEELSSNYAYNLTGGEALTYHEVATIFTAVLERPIHYENPTLCRFIWQMLEQGLSLSFILVMAGIYATVRCGLADTVTGDVQQLLDRPPITMRQYVRDYRQFWLSVPSE
jgi:uncharacterized protein YbjT (DUF2867 family)